jgi:hypothetical protein
MGFEALTANTEGGSNTAIGNLALSSSQTTSNNVCVGAQAGSLLTTADNNIIIGHHSGVHSVFGQESDRCFIDNIFGAPVSTATAAVVMVDSDGRLGTVTADGPNAQAIPDSVKQAMLNLKVQKLRAAAVHQQQQLKTLTTKLKEQAAQIKEVNTGLETSKPAPQAIADKP